MNMVKSLILSSAAGLVAMSGAQAADLPVKAKAVEYVKICSLYGAGFYYIPGTDTCIKLSGYLRAEIAVNTNSVYTGNTSGAGGARNRFTNAFTWRSREDFDIDTRTATEYGVVRTYFDSTFTWTSDTYVGNGVGGTVYGGTAVGAASNQFGTNINNVFANPNNAGSGAVAGGTLGMYYAFIQFAGFTMGKAISQFSAPWTAYPGNNFDGLVGGGGTVTGVNQFTYTAELGNGVSVALSAQDPTAYYQAGVNSVFLSAASTNGSGVNAGTTGFNGQPGGSTTGQFAAIGNNSAFPLANLGNSGAYGTSDYGGTLIPDFVAMLRVDQAWGLFQLSAAAHDNVAAYYGATELSGHPGDRWGWAVQAALSIKNIPTGAGDTLNVQGVYTDGATRYNIQDLAAGAGGNTIYGGNTANGTATVGLGTATDTVFGPGGQQQLTRTWGMRGGFTHNWSPYWNSGIYGAYAAVSYNGAAKTLLCGNGTTGGSIQAVLNPSSAAGTVPASGFNTGGCNPDYNIAQLGFITRWNPVKNLTFSVDYTYTHLDQKMSGTVVLPSAAVGKPAVLYALSDQDTHQVLLRAQRNW